MKNGSEVWLKAVRQGATIVVLAAVLGLSVNQVRTNGLGLRGDWSPAAQLTLDSGDSLEISLDEAEMMYLAQLAVFLDARSPEFYEEGHIAGALNLPPDDHDGRFADVLADLPQETLLIAYCDGESCNLSKDLAFALLDRGYTNVRVLVNGWTIWQEKGLPIERGGGTQ